MYKFTAKNRFKKISGYNNNNMSSAAHRIPIELVRKIEIMTYQLNPHPCAKLIKDYAEDFFISNYIWTIENQFWNKVFSTNWDNTRVRGIMALLAKADLLYKDYKHDKIRDEYINKIGFKTWDMMVMENGKIQPKSKICIDCYKLERTEYKTLKKILVEYSTQIDKLNKLYLDMNGKKS